MKFRWLDCGCKPCNFGGAIFILKQNLIYIEIFGGPVGKQELLIDASRISLKEKSSLPYQFYNSAFFCSNKVQDDGLV